MIFVVAVHLVYLSEEYFPLKNYKICSLDSCKWMKTDSLESDTKSQALSLLTGLWKVVILVSHNQLCYPCGKLVLGSEVWNLTLFRWEMLLDLST